jgi:hypothetical protein
MQISAISPDGAQDEIPPSGVDSGDPETTMMASPKLKTMFVHAPKCGGTTAWVYLSSMYAPDRSMHAIGKGHMPGSINVVDLYEEKYDNTKIIYDLINGHIEYEKAIKWGKNNIFDDYCAITILRDPISRARSRYTYGRKYPELAGSTWYREVNFEQYIRTFVDEPHLHNDMANFVTGQRTPRAALDIIERDYVAAVPLEALAEFLQAYCGLLGGSCGDPHAVLNETGPADPTWETVSPELVEAFMTISEADTAIHQWALNNWRGHMERKIADRLEPLSR